MPFSLIQQNSGTANGTSITVNYGSAPTNGNLLIGVIGSNDGAATDPTGWSTAINKVNITDDDFVRISYKVAGAGETSAVAFTGLVGNSHGLGILEFAVPISLPLDVTSSAGESLAATTQTSGTTAATAQADELSIVGFQIRADVTSPSLSNGFTLQHDLFNAVTVLVGYKIERATGAKESTASWTVGGNSIGVIATFKAAATAGNFLGYRSSLLVFG
jgi:hypothetical protein